MLSNGWRKIGAKDQNGFQGDIHGDGLMAKWIDNQTEDSPFISGHAGNHFIQISSRTSALINNRSVPLGNK